MATHTTNYNLTKPEASDPFADFREDYNSNLDIIDANLGGGGGGDVMDVEVNGVSVVDGNKVAKITSYKEVTQAQYDALPASKLTDGIAYFIKDGGGSGSGGSFLLVITAETGETVTATKDGTTLTATEVSTGVYEVEVTSAGTWTLSDGTNTETVDVGVYTATLSSIPEGSTVIPTDDVTIWLACAGRSENYTTVGEVLADSTCLLALLSDNNANDYLVRSATWASTITADSSAMSYIGLNNYCSNTLLSDITWRTAICNSTYFESVLNAKVPVMTSNTTPSGVANQSEYSDNSHLAWGAFDNNASTSWNTNANPSNAWIQYEFVNKVKIYKMSVTSTYATKRRLKTFSLLASDDNFVNYDTLISLTTLPDNNVVSFDFVCEPTMERKTYRIANITSYIGNAQIYTLQFYGRKDI